MYMSTHIIYNFYFEHVTVENMALNKCLLVAPKENPLHVPLAAIT